ncbi:MAG: cyanophycinase, partial [Candidatus Sericytochromatia bacterium]
AGQPSGDRSRAALEGVGARHVTVLTGDPARLAAERAAIRAAWGVWFTGGLPDKLLGAFDPYREATDAAWRAGATIGGTSAGAMAWGDRLIMRGEGSEAPVLEPGLGFLPGLLIDPHFGARSRFGRLWTATGETGALGLGVDEETAAIVGSDGSLEVYGAGAVTVIKPEGAAARVTLLRNRETLNLRDWGLGRD